MAVNKVEINGVVKLDLTQDTVTAAQLAQGVTAHDASGEIITGTMTAPQLQIVVTTSAGATVTATKGSKTVSGTADADGQCTLTVDEPGTWSVVAELNDVSGSADVTVGTNTVFLQVFNPVFANNDWATIIKLCQENRIPDAWHIGDSCSMTINNKTYAIDIIGKNHDDYADGSGKAPLTFQLHDCYQTTYGMKTSTSNSGGWERSTMRTNYLPTILEHMPADVKRSIREVNKSTTIGGASSTIKTVSDKLFLLSEIEITGSNTYTVAGEGSRYDYYASGGSRKKKLDGTYNTWWSRSPVSKNSADQPNRFVDVYEDGDVGNDRSNMKAGVSFAFCF